MSYPDENPLVSKEDLILLGQKCLSDLYDAAQTEIKKLQIQRLWYQSMHKFSGSAMQSVLSDDFEVDRCPSDMDRCRDGSCMPPGQC